MSAMIGRRDFLRWRLSTDEIVRPPAALPESEFLDCCDGCGDCLEACPQGILSLIEDTPRIDFALGDGACIFCDDCTNACPTGALDASRARSWTWKAEIVFSKCLSYRGVTCRVCADTCEPRAIRFTPLPGGRDVLMLDPETCTGCGACKSVCPVSAVRLVETAEVAREIAL